MSGLCLLLVGVLAPLSIVTMWAHDQVADTDRCVETVSFRTSIRTVVLGGAVLIYALADHPTGESTLILVIVAGLILLVTELLAQNGEPPTDVALDESSAHQT